MESRNYTEEAYELVRKWHEHENVQPVTFKQYLAQYIKAKKCPKASLPVPQHLLCPAALSTTPSTTPSTSTVTAQPSEILPATLLTPTSTITITAQSAQPSATLPKTLSTPPSPSISMTAAATQVDQKSAPLQRIDPALASRTSATITTIQQIGSEDDAIETLLKLKSVPEDAESGYTADERRAYKENVFKVGGQGNALHLLH